MEWVIRMKLWAGDGILDSELLLPDAIEYADDAQFASILKKVPKTMSKWYIERIFYACSAAKKPQRLYQILNHFHVQFSNNPMEYHYLPDFFRWRNSVCFRPLIRYCAEQSIAIPLSDRGETIVHHMAQQSIDACTAALFYFPQYASARTFAGETPLFYACTSCESTENVQFLLQMRDCNPAIAREDGRTALHAAAMHDHTAAIALLLAHKSVDPNALSRHGFTPLMDAVLHHHADAVNRLLQDGRVRLDLRTEAGDTAESLARRLEHAELVDLLVQHAAAIPRICAPPK